MIGKKIKFQPIFSGESEGIILDKVITTTSDSPAGITGYLVEITTSGSYNEGDTKVVIATDIRQVFQEKTNV